MAIIIRPASAGRRRSFRVRQIVSDLMLTGSQKNLAAFSGLNRKYFREKLGIAGLARLSAAINDFPDPLLKKVPQSILNLATVLGKDSIGHVNHVNRFI